jgi:hypothetical protein
MKTLNCGRVRIALCALALVLGGCSSYTLDWPLANLASTSSAKPSTPEVQNCLNVNGGTGAITTPEYVCNGKVYSSRQLRQLRQESASGTSSSHS